MRTVTVRSLREDGALTAWMPYSFFATTLLWQLYDQSGFVPAITAEADPRRVVMGRCLRGDAISFIWHLLDGCLIVLTDDLLLFSVDHHFAETWPSSVHFIVFLQTFVATGSILSFQSYLLLSLIPYSLYWTPSSFSADHNLSTQKLVSRLCAFFSLLSLVLTDPIFSLLDTFQFLS